MTISGASHPEIEQSPNLLIRLACPEVADCKALSRGNCTRESARLGVEGRHREPQPKGGRESASAGCARKGISRVAERTGTVLLAGFNRRSQ